MRESKRKNMVNSYYRKDLLNNKLIKEENGITLVALIVTVVIIVILAGVSVKLLTGNNGLIGIARNKKEDIDLTINAQEEEIRRLEGGEGKENRPNSPVLLTGMTPIKFTMPTDEKMGKAVKTTAGDSDWYEYGTTYETRRWANAKTEDGSMWVWIPRFAYRVNKENETFDVVFLIGTTDKYYDENGDIKTAKRQTSENQVIDTTVGYTVHPAFTNESKINYANGGWDKELTGIWVAKFQAGYASGNNKATVKSSSVYYTQSTSWVHKTELGASSNSIANARNWLDGIYGGNKTSIKYPTFQGATYTMTYITQNDVFNIAKVLNETGNIYGLSETDSDSHLMKNSEWGACVYLSASIYGQNEKEITINNANLNSGGAKRTSSAGKSNVDSVYSVTGCTNNATDVGEVITTISAINNVIKDTPTSNGIFTWNQKTGQNASTTGTIYGIYDMSGAMWERTAAYIANGNDSLKSYGASISYSSGTLKTISSKYTTVYPYNEKDSNGNAISNINTASQQNFAANSKIYGDAVRETNSGKAGTSESGWNSSSWNGDNSSFPALYSPFFLRGGNLWNGSVAGAYAFLRGNGNTDCYYGFRAVLINK